MLERFRKIKEPYRMLIIGAMTLAVLVIAQAWPVVASLVWIAFLAFLALILYLELRKPVNYDSLEFDSDGFCHTGIGGVSKAAWSDVRDVFYVRSIEPFTNEMETEWEFVLHSGADLTVLVEWGHSRSFASAIQENLSIVSRQKIAEARKKRGEGRWRCVAQ